MTTEVPGQERLKVDPPSQRQPHSLLVHPRRRVGLHASTSPAAHPHPSLRLIDTAYEGTFEVRATTAGVVSASPTLDVTNLGAGCRHDHIHRPVGVGSHDHLQRVWDDKGLQLSSTSHTRPGPRRRLPPQNHRCWDQHYLYRCLNPLPASGESSNEASSFPRPPLDGLYVLCDNDVVHRQVSGFLTVIVVTLSPVPAGCRMRRRRSLAGQYPGRIATSLLLCS